jgi:hypothetical protein
MDWCQHWPIADHNATSLWSNLWQSFFADSELRHNVIGIVFVFLWLNKLCSWPQDFNRLSHCRILQLICILHVREKFDRWALFHKQKRFLSCCDRFLCFTDGFKSDSKCFWASKVFAWIDQNLCWYHREWKSNFWPILLPLDGDSNHLSSKWHYSCRYLFFSVHDNWQLNRAESFWHFDRNILSFLRR